MEKAVRQTSCTTATLCALLLCACSNQQIYDSAQQNRALECQKYPDSRYEDCMATIDKDYATYERELENIEAEPREEP